MNSFSPKAWLYTRPERIPLEDVDASGFMYHGNFLKYYDRARTDFLRSLGFSHGEMIKRGSFFVVKSAAQEFIKPVLLEMEILSTVDLKRIGRTSLMFFQALQSAGGLLAQATITLVFISPSLKPTPLPEALIEALQAKEKETRKACD